MEEDTLEDLVRGCSSNSRPSKWNNLKDSTLYCRGGYGELPGGKPKTCISISSFVFGQGCLHVWSAPNSLMPYKTDSVLVQADTVWLAVVLQHWVIF